MLKFFAQIISPTEPSPRDPTTTSTTTETTTSTTALATIAQEKSRHRNHEPYTSTEPSTSSPQTTSNHYDRRPKKHSAKSSQLVIYQTDDREILDVQQPKIVITNANQTVSNRQISPTYDNIGFVSDNGRLPPRVGNGANSIRSSGRNPSLQSVSIVREQYWCCSQRPPRERILLASICVLSFMIVILAVAVIVLAIQHSDTS